MLFIGGGFIEFRYSHFKKLPVQYIHIFHVNYWNFAALHVFSCTKLIRWCRLKFECLQGLFDSQYTAIGGVWPVCAPPIRCPNILAALSKQSRRPVIITSAPICLPTGPFTPLCCPRNYNDLTPLQDHFTNLALLLFKGRISLICSEGLYIVCGICLDKG